MKELLYLIFVYAIILGFIQFRNHRIKVANQRRVARFKQALAEYEQADKIEKFLINND